MNFCTKLTDIGIAILLQSPPKARALCYVCLFVAWSWLWRELITSVIGATLDYLVINTLKFIHQIITLKYGKKAENILNKFP